MQIKLKVSDKNFVDFNVYYATHAPTYYRSITLMAAMAPLPLAAAAFVAVDRLPEYQWFWLLFAGMVSIYWIVTTPARFRRNIRNQAYRFRGECREFISEFTIELLHDKLVYAGRSLSAEYLYSDVQKVVWNQGCYYIFIEPEAVLIIPEMSFANQVEEQQFLDFIRDRAPQAEFRVI